MAKAGDRLPDIPGPDPLINALALALGLHPIGRGLLAGYMAAENTERWWGPPVERSAQWTAKQWEEYQDWYETNIRRKYAGSEIDPRTPIMLRPGQTIPPTPESLKAATVKPKKRKLTKSNKAMSGLYKFLAKEQKSRMTQAKARKLLTRCAKIVGKANPNTKSRIGKGKSTNQKLARKCRMDYWGTKKRN